MELELKSFFIICSLLLLIFGNASAKDITVDKKEISTSYLKFTNDLLIDKTFYIVEDSGYDTIVKFYLNNGKLKMFYVIFYKGKLDETATIDAMIDQNGYIKYTVFHRPTELKLLKITNSEYVVKEYHSKQPKHTLKIQFSKPKGFAE